jgi:hypothetical protein
MTSSASRLPFLCTGLVAALFAIEPVLAQEPEKPAAPAPRDFGRGFAKFYKLGLPDAAGGRYVKFTFRSGYPRNSGMNDYAMSQAQIKGNGWLVEADATNAPHRYVTGVNAYDVYDRKTVERENRARRKAAMEKAKAEGGNVTFSSRDASDKASGTWKDVDAAADAEKLISYLDKQSQERHRMHQIQRLSGTAFLGAAHLHRNGYTNEANRIVAKLFEVSDDRQQVILGALNTLADAQFEKTTDSFFKELDWEAYQAQLLALLKRFRSGWQKAPAIKRLYTVVQAHLLNPTPTAIQGEGISEEDQALAHALCSMTQKDAKVRHYRSSYSEWNDRTLWTLTAPASDATEETEVADGEASDAASNSNIIARIRMRGFEAVPLLMAMLEDDYLTCMNAQQAVGGGRSYYSSSSSEMTEERITELYNQLNRPATRGEIARAMLKQVLPVDDQDRRDVDTMDVEGFKETVSEWYEANRSKAPLALARGYMTDGSRQQKSSAIMYLSQFGSDDDLAIVEKTFLEGERYEYSSQITQYVQRRGDKAKAFVSAYTNHLMEIAEEDEGNAEWATRTIKQLEQVVSAGTFEEILEEVASGKKALADVRSILYTRMHQNTDPKKSLHAVLDAATRVPDVQTANMLLNMVLQVRNARGMHRRGGAPLPPPELGPNLDLWKQLLADKRILSRQQTQGVVMTLGDRAAWTLEYFCADTTDGQGLRQIAMLGNRILPLLRKRATARLEGKSQEELPALPSADNVSEEAVKALLTQLEGGDAIAETIEGASLDALLALREPFTEQSNLWTSTVGVAHRINSVEIDEPLRDQLQHLSTLKGKQLQPDMLEKWISDGLAVAASGKVANIAIARQTALDGIAITATLIDTNLTQFAAWSHYLRNGDKQGRARVSVNLSFPAVHKSAQFYSDAPAEAAEDEVEADGDMLDEFMDELEDDTNQSAVEDQAEMRKVLADCCAPKCNVYPAASIQIVAIPAPPEGATTESVRSRGFLVDPF